jgi:hypothetical protein
MPDVESTQGVENERTSRSAKEKIEKLETRLKEVERVLAAFAKGFKRVEDEIDEPVLDTGTYYGVEFVD